MVREMSRRERVQKRVETDRGWERDGDAVTARFEAA